MFINPIKVVETVAQSRAVRKIAAQSAKVLTSQAREMEYVPKYLELAKVGEKYRFNPKEVEELTKAFEGFVTDGSKTDILKDLLAVGAKDGKQFSVDEIKQILEASSGYEPKAQKNIIRFVKHAREDLLVSENRRVTVAQMQERHPYSQLREKNYNFHKRINPDQPFNEEETKKEYREMISRMVNYENDPINRHVIVGQQNKNNPLRFVKHGEGAMLDAIATCDNPEILADIVNAYGATNATRYCANALIKLAHMISGEDATIIQTLSEHFYPAEITRIVNALIKNKKTIEIKDLYDKLTKCRTLDSKRKLILRELQVDNMVRVPGVKIKYMPMPRQLDGDCGRGKSAR